MAACPSPPQAECIKTVYEELAIRGQFKTTAVFDAFIVLPESLSNTLQVMQK